MVVSVFDRTREYINITARRRDICIILSAAVAAERAAVAASGTVVDGQASRGVRQATVAAGGQLRCALSLVGVCGCSWLRRRAAGCLCARTQEANRDLMTALDFYEYPQPILVDVRQDESNRAMNKHNTINMNEILRSEISFSR